MWFGFVSLFPDLVHGVMSTGVVGRGIQTGHVSYEVFNPRDYTEDKHRTVDDRPYGGGAGMVMRYEPLRDAIVAAKRAAPDGAVVVVLSPQGRRVNQSLVNSATNQPGYIFICGRLEVDATLTHESKSLGDGQGVEVRLRFNNGL